MSDFFEYKKLAHTESFGQRSFGIKILVASNAPLDVKADDLQEVGCKVRQMIEDALEVHVIAKDPEERARARNERRSLIDLFPAPIFVEEIPNGYSKAAWFSHLPWFIVTTTIGRFKIGWRKRVIHIEWTDTLVKRTADDLFPDEDVTKDYFMIHAWGLEKARHYIDVVMKAGQA